LPDFFNYRYVCRISVTVIGPDPEQITFLIGDLELLVSLRLLAAGRYDLLMGVIDIGRNEFPGSASDESSESSTNSLDLSLLLLLPPPRLPPLVS
jgi:hypothetical protein